MSLVRREFQALIFLLLSLMGSIVFLLFPHQVCSENGQCEDLQYGFFPFSDQLLSPKQYIWFFFEHGTLVFIGLAVIKYSTKFTFSAKVFLWIQIADTVDFMLTYGDAWTRSPITFNTVKVITFGASIAYDYIKHVGATKGS